MRKKIAVLGASYLQLPLILKAKNHDIETHCFAWDNEDAVCKHEADFFYDISVLDAERILEKCLEIGIDGITTIATDICIPVICLIADRMGLISNSIQSGYVSTNKYAMRRALLQAGVGCPKFISVEAYNENLFSNFSFPVIVKPTDRSGSRGVSKVNDLSGLEGALMTSISQSLEKKCIVEEFIEGVEVSVECISWKGSHYLLAVTDKVTTGPPYFVELQHHQPSLLSDPTISKIAEEAFKALDALDIKFGASHSEFKITEAGDVVAIEIGARMGGDFIGSHLVELSTGYDFLKGVLDVALNQFTEPVIKKSRYSGVYFLSKDSEQILPYFNQTNSFDIEKRMLNNELAFITNSNDRSGYLIYADERKVKI